MRFIFRMDFVAFYWCNENGNSGGWWGWKPIPVEEEAYAFPERKVSAEKSRGRGGKVLFVTNLKDSGPREVYGQPSSLRSRYVVFNVSAIIELKSALKIRTQYHYSRPDCTRRWHFASKLSGWSECRQCDYPFFAFPYGRWSTTRSWRAGREVS